MGLLDDLKNQAKEKEEKEKQREAELQAQQLYYDKHLHSVMRQAHAYFLELVQQLKIVQPEVSPEFSLGPENEPPITLRQDDYVFRADNTEKPRSIVVSCECHLDEPCEFYVRTKTAVSSYAEMLDSLGFPHYRKNEMDERLDVANATFVLEGPMKSQIRLVASPENKCIHVDLFNIDRQPRKRYRLSPEKVDETLLDRLARLLLREDATLVEVEVSDEVREELRRKLEEDNQRRAQEQARAIADREAERLAEEEARMINRAKRTVKGSIKKILSKDS